MSSSQSEIPNLPEKFDRARQLQSQGDTSGAIFEYRSILEIEPENLAALHQLGQLSEAQGDFAAAVEYYQKSVEIDSEPPFWVYRHLGFALSQQERLDEAIEAYQKAIDLNPDEVQNYSLLGQVRGKQGDWAGAIESYQKAIELSEEVPVWVYLNLGEALSQQEKFEEAIVAYEKALELAPENAGIRRLLDEATAQYELSCQTDRVSEHFDLARELQSSGQLETALSEYQKIVEGDRNYLAALHQVAQIYESQGKWEEAIERYRKAIDLDTNPPFWVYRHLGFALSQQEQLDEAIEAYQRAIELNPEDAATHSLLGQAYRKMDNVESAIESYQRAIELDSKSPVWIYSSLNELLRQKEWKDAESRVERTDLGLQSRSITEPQSILWQQLHPQIAAVLADYCQTIDRLSGNSIKSNETVSQEVKYTLRAICLALGNLLIQSGNLAEATQFHQRTNTILESSSNYLEDIKNSFKNLVSAFEALGLVSEAEHISDKLRREIIEFYGFKFENNNPILDYVSYYKKYINPEFQGSQLNSTKQILVFENWISKIQLINSSVLFSLNFYLATNKHTNSISKIGEKNKIEIIGEYIELGYLENTHPLFNAYYYIHQSPSLAKVNHINPLIHFLEIGWKKGRDPHPMFDTSYYLDCNPDVRQSGMNPLEHFLKFGWKEGHRNPHPLFNTLYYLANNPDLKGTELNPLQHFIEFGVWEGRNPHPLFNTSYYRENHITANEDLINPVQHFIEIGAFTQRDPHPLFSLKNYTDYLQSISKPLKSDENPLLHYLKSEKNSSLFARLPWKSSNYSILDQKGHYDILIFSHDASRTGAPRVLLAFLKQIRQYQEQHNQDINIWIVLVRDGELKAEFEECGLTLVLSELDEQTKTYDQNLQELLKGFRKFTCNPLVLVNTSAISQVNEMCYKIKLPLVSWIHELPVTIESYCGGLESFNRVLVSSKKIISVSNFVASSLIKYSGQEKDADKYVTIYASPPSLDREKEEVQELDFYKSKLRQEFSIPDSAFVVLGCGTVQDRKGCDFFVQVAHQVIKIHQMTDIYFIWVGAKVQPEFSMWLEDDIQKLGIKANVIFAGARINPLEYMRGSDTFLLTSREDPFPLVNMEAMYCGLPVITFLGNGGASEIFENLRGIAVPYLDISEMAKSVIMLKNNKKLRREIGLNATNHITTHLTWENFVQSFISLIKTDYEYYSVKTLKLTVIIPNYNCEKFIRERLTTVLNQTTKPDEIILLDDKSVDQSLKIAVEILKHTDIPYKVILNEENTGSPFKQWVKGIREATGDLIWIAESDDSCEINLVKKLKQQFYDPEVVLAYSQSAPMGEEGQIWDRNYLSYTNELDSEKWSYHYKNQGVNEITHALCLKNTIPNASAVIFKKAELTEEYLSHIQNFRFVGDWLLYFSVAKSGKVAFVADSLNYHRRHSKTVTALVEKEDSHAVEVLELKKHILSHDFISANAITESLARTIDDYYELNSRHSLNRKSFLSNSSFEKSVETIRSNFEQRYLKASYPSPSLLFIIGDADFGGGQIAAIRVANELAKKYRVFLCNARPWTYNENFIDLIDRKVILIEGSLKPKPWSGYPERRLEVLRDLIKFHKIDTIFSHIWWGDRLAYEINQELKLPWFIQMHGCYEFMVENPEVDEHFMQYIKPMMKLVSGVAYLTDKNLTVFDKLEINPPQKTARFFNGFDQSSVNFDSPEAKLISRSDSDFVFCLCSRAIPEKGWEEAIQATLAINQLPPEQRNSKTARLVLIGDSCYAQDLKMKYNDNEEITFLGQQKNPTNFYSQCDVGLLPSKFKSESVPCCIIEYLACNLPVIATQVGSIPEMIVFEGQKSGLLIPLNDDWQLDVAKLQEMMLEYIINQPKYMLHKQSTQSIFYHSFNIKSLAKKYINFLMKSKNNNI